MAIISKSIHPRNHYLVDKTEKRGEKQNTAKNRNPDRKGALQGRERALNDRRNSMATTIRNSKQPQQWRMPGTMRGW